ncbi:MAG TPA: hypothetical protein VK978_02310 [Candidatus Saccharimonadales bacterium]|nr:hypothetical protein [Candidatus Saccharimonadales bacterium]
MSEAISYGIQQSPYHTEQEQREIAAIATKQGAIAAGGSIAMIDLYVNYARMLFPDDSDMTMHHVSDDSEARLTTPNSDDTRLDAEALAIANLALTITESGGEQSAEDYIGSGTRLHEKAKEYLPLVLRQRGQL